MEDEAMEKTIVVVPTYNEEKTVGAVLSGLLHNGFKHILVVDDGSRDLTLQVVSQYPVKAVSHLVNLGYGSALRTGFEYAIRMGFEYCITFDADLQMRADDAFRILKRSRETGYGYVYGCRDFDLPGVPKIRKIVGMLADILTFIISGKYVRDTQSGLRVMRRFLLQKLNLKSRGFSIPSELVAEAVRNGEVPRPVKVDAIYTKESLKKGQKISNSFRVIRELLG